MPVEALPGFTVDQPNIQPLPGFTVDAPHPAALDTSNPSGEGTYKMVGPQGQQVQVPFSKVRGAQDSQFMVDPADAGRYQKDAGATQHPVMDYVDKTFANNPGADAGGTDEALRPVGNFGRRIVRDIAAPIATIPTAVNTVYNAATGDPSAQDKVASFAEDQGEFGSKSLLNQGKQYVQTAKTQGPMQAVTDAAGDLGAMYLTGKATGALTDAAGSAMAEKPPVPYTPAHAAAFEGAIAPATAMGKNFIPQEITPEALPAIRTAAARMATGTPEEQAAVQAATSPSTPPLKRIQAYQDVVQGSLNDLEAQHAPALAHAANVPVDTAPIVSQLEALKTPTMKPADVAAIDELIDQTKGAATIGDLGKFRQELNISTSPEYRQSAVQAGRSGLSAQAESDLAGWVRNAYYDHLGDATGTDFAPLKRQEANLITTKEALQNQAAPLAKAEATYAAPATLRETAGNVANIIKDPKTTVTQTLLRESPATRVSTLLKKSLADLPPGQPAPTFTPPAAAPAPRPLALPARAGGAYPMPGMVPYSPGMSAGEQSAALNQWLRRRQQMGLPAEASPIQLPPPRQ